MIMAKDEWVSFKCITVEQPVGTFYVGSISAVDVIEIAYADIRRIEARDIEKIVGIQRDLNSGRVKELKQYVRTIDASFPTSIILAVDDKYAQFDSKTNLMRIKRLPDIAKIIDGQHRLAGLEGFQGTFELNVTVFVDMDVQDQAMTFATINLAQTKVGKSLVYDLYEFQKARSPQKTSHNIARLLNSESGSPLQDRIKILGKATGESFQYITQATFVERLLPYITKDKISAIQDRDLLRRKKKLEPAVGADAERLIFRPLFIAEKDAEIARIVWNFFEAVAARWPDAWNSTDQGDMLNRTNGFSGLMKFLGPMYRSQSDARGRLSKESVLTILKRIKLRDIDFNRDNYRPGTSGETHLYKDLLEKSGIE
jgi:DGQHR domain-containing protein